MFRLLLLLSLAWPMLSLPGLAAPLDLPKKKVETSSILLCELLDLPERAKAGSEIKLKIVVKNPGKESLTIVPYHVEYVTSVGTGVGIDIKPFSKEEKPKVDPPLPKPLQRRIMLHADADKPEDILAIIKANEIKPGKDGQLEFEVTIKLPQGPGEYQISSYARSWAYFGIRNGIPMISQDDVDKHYLEKQSSPAKKLIVEK